MTWRDWLFTALAATGVALILAALPFPARALATALLVPLPVLSIAQARTLAAMDLDTLPRLQIYVSSTITLWMLAFSAVAAAQYSGFPAALIGFDDISRRVFVAWLIFLLAAALLIVAVDAYFEIQDSPILRHLLPRSWVERIVFVLVAITAGITEEIIFRGFLITALTAVMQNAWTAAVAASVAFGMLHAYQGWSGIIRTAIIGFALAVPFLMTSSIMPSIAAHIIIDLVGGLWLVKKLP